MQEPVGFRVTRERGDVLTIGGRSVVPIAMVVSFRATWHGRGGGFFSWAHPLAVEVRDGVRKEILPVPDLAMWGVAGLGLLGAVIAAVSALVVKTGRAGGVKR